MTPLGVVLMLARHYEQPLSEIRRLPWPAFCALWARCIDEDRARLRREWRQRERREAQETERELKRRLEFGE